MQLVAEHLSKRYRKRVVVSDASYFVNPGQIVGLLGPNGAGKTTAFYMTVGLVKPDTGRIYLDGKDITRLPMHKRAQAGIGYLPQEASVFRKMSVFDNVYAVLQLQQMSKKHARARASALLEEFNITHIKDTLGMSLSGGERRRVEIARCLATNPRYVLLDEPFAGVDPISVQDIMDIMTHLKNRGIGVLVTDHNVRETLTICDHAYILSGGKMLTHGLPDEVLANEEVRRVYLGNNFSI